MHVNFLRTLPDSYEQYTVKTHPKYVKMFSYSHSIECVYQVDKSVWTQFQDYMNARPSIFYAILRFLKNFMQASQIRNNFFQLKFF